ncbi:MAG: biopolymer transporter ExbD [Bacteroidaceae bacterium]|nr:biopolymer transporter ExbD [Bacteroidaceae bacterium]MBR6602151.1 biopolymer transporter ExbD [Bacteroidaceae bacterium]
MGKFNKGGSKEVPELNTSSLPDLIFSILFFFMMVTSMREVTLKVEFETPKGTEIQKLEKKSLVSYVYIGKPTKEFRSKMGTASQIQLNDDFATVDAIGEYVYQERESMPERDKPFMRVSMKIDKETQMGVVTDVKMALREAWALNVVYSGGKRQ